MRLLLFLVPFSILSFSSYACDSLPNCLKEASALTGQDYIYVEDFKPSKTSYPKLTTENANLMISNLLDMNGYTRIRIDDKTWKVISARDIRYHALTTLEADQENRPEFTNDADYRMLRYRMANPQVLKEVTRSLRPFLSRYGRIIDMPVSGILLVQDRTDNLARIYDIVREADKEPTKEQLDKIRRAEERDFQIRYAKARACKQEE